MADKDVFSSNNIEVREARGAASAVTIATSFKPSLIILLNATEPSVSFWVPSLGNPGYFKLDDTGSGTGDITSGTTNGITAAPGGLTLGTAVQANNDVLHLILFR